MGKYLLTLRTTAVRLMCLLALLLFSPFSVAVKFEELSVTESQGGYQLRVNSIFDAPARYVYFVITDYKNFYRINPSVVEAKIQPTNRDAVVRVNVRLEDRIGPFKFNIDWVGDVEEGRLGELKVTTIPNLSSFESGFATWEIYPEGEHTRVIHESWLKPKFFIAPVIGDYLVRSHMKDVTIDTFDKIECHANIKLDIDMENDPLQMKVLAKKMRDCTETNRLEANLYLESE